MSISIPTPSRSRITPSSPSDLEGLVGPDEAEHGRTDDHTGDDLAHDRGHIDPLRDLSSQLRRNEHDEDVEQDRADVHGVRRSSAGAVCVDVLEEVAASPHRADLESQGTNSPPKAHDENIERVPGGAMVLPGDPYECLVVDHIVKTVDQDGRKRSFGW